MRWLSRLSVVLIICLVTAGLLAAPVQAAAPSITVIPSSGVPGTEVTVRGYNFTTDAWVDVYYYVDTARTWEVEEQTDDDGYFEVTFTIRETYAGVHKVRAELSSSNYVEDDFTVKPGLTVYPEEGPVATNVTVRGQGFNKSETGIKIWYYLNSTSPILMLGNVTANVTGSWQRSFEVPLSSQGPHRIDAEGAVSDLSDVDDASFNVKPVIALGTTSGSPGQNITMTGNGFHTGDTYIKILFEGEETQTGIIRADVNGYWEGDFQVPRMPIGTYSVTAQGAWTQQEDITPLSFEMRPGLVLSPSEGHVDTELFVTGYGFPDNDDVDVMYDGNQMGITETNDHGSFETSFIVPDSQHGQRTVTARDAAGNNATAIFTMESVPPGTPELDSPPDGDRIGFIGGVRPTFNWSAVTDDSGVYYSLQIATSPNVTAGGFADPVRSITGITATNYTLNGTQALPYGTYYWIVRTVDRAGNAGDWTAAISFHAGVLPLWAFILIIVVAVAVIGTLVYFFIIRKRTYYY